MNEQYMGYAPPLAMPSEKADVIDKIQPGKVVEEIRQRLLGKEEINGRWVVNPFMEARALTEIGAWEICSLMLPASSQNTAMTKLNPVQIRSRLLNLTRTAQFMCLRNWKEYGIKGTDQLWFVHEIVFTNTLAALNQPEGEGMRRFIGNVGQGDIGYVPEQETKSGGIMGVFRR
jgi:hypothetical protein